MRNDAKRVTNDISNLGKLLGVFIQKHLTEIPSLKTNNFCKRFDIQVGLRHDPNDIEESKPSGLWKRPDTYTSKYVKELQGKLADEKKGILGFPTMRTPSYVRCLQPPTRMDYFSGPG